MTVSVGEDLTNLIAMDAPLTGNRPGYTISFKAPAIVVRFTADGVVDTASNGFAGFVGALTVT